MAHPDRVLSIAIVHTALMALAVLAETAGGLTDGWLSIQLLLVLFFGAPLAAGLMNREGQVRFAGILLLSFMGAGIVINCRFVLTRVALPIEGWSLVSVGALAGLILSELAGAVAAVALIRRYHASRTSPPSA